MGRINVTIRIFVGTLVPNTWASANRAGMQVHLQLRLHLQAHALSELRRKKQRAMQGFLRYWMRETTGSDAHLYLGAAQGAQHPYLRDCTCTGSLL